MSFDPSFMSGLPVMDNGYNERSVNPIGPTTTVIDPNYLRNTGQEQEEDKSGGQEHVPLSEQPPAATLEFLRMRRKRKDNPLDTIYIGANVKRSLVDDVTAALQDANIDESSTSASCALASASDSSSSSSPSSSSSSSSSSSTEATPSRRPRLIIYRRVTTLPSFPDVESAKHLSANVDSTSSSSSSSSSTSHGHMSLKEAHDKVHAQLVKQHLTSANEYAYIPTTIVASSSTSSSLSLSAPTAGATATAGAGAGSSSTESSSPSSVATVADSLVKFVDAMPAAEAARYKEERARQSRIAKTLAKAKRDMNMKHLRNITRRTAGYGGGSDDDEDDDDDDDVDGVEDNRLGRGSYGKRGLPPTSSLALDSYTQTKLAQKRLANGGGGADAGSEDRNGNNANVDDDSEDNEDVFDVYEPVEVDETAAKTLLGPEGLSGQSSAEVAVLNAAEIDQLLFKERELVFGEDALSGDEYDTDDTEREGIDYPDDEDDDDDDDDDYDEDGDEDDDEYEYGSKARRRARRERENGGGYNDRSGRMYRYRDDDDDDEDEDDGDDDDDDYAGTGFRGESEYNTWRRSVGMSVAGYHKQAAKAAGLGIKLSSNSRAHKGKGMGDDDDDEKEGTSRMGAEVGSVSHKLIGSTSTASSSSAGRGNGNSGGGGGGGGGSGKAAWEKAWTEQAKHLHDRFTESDSGQEYSD